MTELGDVPHQANKLDLSQVLRTEALWEAGVLVERSDLQSGALGFSEFRVSVS